MTGVIGPVREVHVWAERAWGLQDAASAEKFDKPHGFYNGIRIVDRFKEEMPIPPTNHWDLWLGPAPARPFHATYFPGPRWYRWWDFGNGKTLAKDLYGRAGITPQDVDVLQIYDHFTGLVLMSLENFGFCGRGEAGPFAAAGNLRWPNGRFPLNTSGGHLSEAYIHGLNLAVEGVRQLRGQSTSQVIDAEVCLVTAGLSGTPLSAALLGV